MAGWQQLAPKLRAPGRSPPTPIELPPAEPPRTRPPGLAPGGARTRSPRGRSTSQGPGCSRAVAERVASAATGGSGLPGASAREAPPPDPLRRPGQRPETTGQVRDPFDFCSRVLFCSL